MRWGTNESGGPMRWGTNEMSGAWVLIGGSMRWGTNEMGNQWDGGPMMCTRTSIWECMEHLVTGHPLSCSTVVVMYFGSLYIGICSQWLYSRGKTCTLAKSVHGTCLRHHQKWSLPRSTVCGQNSYGLYHMYQSLLSSRHSSTVSISKNHVFIEKITKLGKHMSLRNSTQWASNLNIQVWIPTVLDIT